MSNIVKIDEKELAQLLNVPFTGHDMGGSNVYPPVINILQSDKQYVAFQDEDEITKKMYGKLFVRNDANTTKDLVDGINVTPIRIEKGYEVRSEEEGIVESGLGFASPAVKESWEERGMRAVNMVKVLVSLYDYEKTEALSKAMQEKTARGEDTPKSEHPFAILVIKGASFGSWFDTENSMRDIASQYFKASMNKVPITAYKLTVSSNKEVNEKGQEFYSLKITPDVNDISEATKFASYTLQMKDYSMFYKVKEAIARSEEAKERLDNLKEETFKKIDKAQEKDDVFEVVETKKIAETEELDLDDLPF